MIKCVFCKQKDNIEEENMDYLDALTYSIVIISLIATILITRLTLKIYSKEGAR